MANEENETAAKDILMIIFLTHTIYNVCENELGDICWDDGWTITTMVIGR